jgi:hypothetical protein
MRRILLAVGALAGASALSAMTFTVTNTADTGAGSLRQAILDANGNPGADTIEFNILGSGVHTISPVTGLPPITSPVTIDGYTQPGTSANTDPAGDDAVLLIELEGSGFPFTQIGLELAAGSSGSTIRGLVVNAWPGPQLQISNSSNSTIAGNFVGTDPTGTIPRPNANNGANLGVYIVGGTATNDVVGGTAPADRNLISGNGHEAVQTLFGSGHKIQGNFMGTDVTGSLPLGNAAGVLINSASNIVGGTVSGAGNLISGNTGTGVAVQGNGASTVVQGNLVGTDVTGTKALGNGEWGVFVNSSTPNVLIGGPAPGARNVISANSGPGVHIYSSMTVIQGNLIGTDVTGTLPLGNALTGAQFGGIFLNGASNCTIGGPNPGEGNVIAFNGGNGVTIFGFGAEAGNTIRGNSIYGQVPYTVPFHPQIGIDLGDDGPSTNDPGDGDTGWNGLQNYPIVTAATPLAPSAGTHILGILHSKPSTAYTLDFYEDAPCLAHPHDFYEGQTYLGAADVVTDGTGAVSFDVTVAGTIEAGSVVVATATDPGGNTSELTPRIVFAITPTSGPAAGGTAVSISGTEFQDGATVTIGGQPAGSVVVANDHTITATAPALGPGTASDITVLDPDGITGTLIKGWLVDFTDVPPLQQFYAYVTTLVQNGITVGVGGGLYGVDQQTLRQQMAVFLMKAKYGICYVPPPCTTPVFADVPCSLSFAPWINELVAEGITGGCGDGTTYCPANPVLRQQMAVLLLRTFEGVGYAPPACVTATFDDVPCDSPFAPWIYELVARNITGGCGNGNYCPASNATRGQMAVFLVKTFGLQ